MIRRLTPAFAVLAAAAALCLLSACGGKPLQLRAATASTAPSGSPALSGSPSPAPTRPSPSSAPSASRTPPPSTPKPTKKPTKPKNSTISAADLGIPGAGTLKIPAWPQNKGYIWRGPVGSQGSTGTSSVALTFDDGPGPYTSQVLDVLDKYHVKATFCIIGEQVSAYAAVIKRMIDDGMTLCDHTWDHNEQLWHLSTHNAAVDMQKMIDAIHKIDPDAQVTYFRNPGGNFSTGTVRISELLGMRPLYWSVDTDDWTRPGVAAIESTVRSKTHTDSVVLMHDGGGNRSETVTALNVLLPELKAKYKLIALPTARTVYVDPGTPASHSPAPSSPAPSSPPPSPPAPAPPAADRPVINADLPRNALAHP